MKKENLLKKKILYLILILNLLFMSSLEGNNIGSFSKILKMNIFLQVHIQLEKHLLYFLFRITIER